MWVFILIWLLPPVMSIDYCKLCANGTHTMCRFKEGPAETCINYTKIILTPGDKGYILDLHNDMRNHVASGQESKGVLGNQPAAADMYILEWDEELAAFAQRWVDQCISVNATVQHDKCRISARFEVGQNIVSTMIQNAQLPELSKLILSWYEQIVNIIPSDVEFFSGGWKNNHFIGEYTQLVWAKTRFVGCAAATFKEDDQYYFRFVCNYGPAGNVLGRPIYRRGEPCSECPYKVCDRIRPNLCAGLSKDMDFKKRKNSPVKKYKDKTTLYNTIDDDEDISETTFNKTNFLDLEKLLNLSNSAVFANITSVNLTQFKTFGYSKSQNFSDMTSPCTQSTVYTAIIAENATDIEVVINTTFKASIYKFNGTKLDNTTNTSSHSEIYDSENTSTETIFLNISTNFEDEEYSLATNMSLASDNSTATPIFENFNNESDYSSNKTKIINWRDKLSNLFLEYLTKYASSYHLNKTLIGEGKKQTKDLLLDLKKNRCQKEFRSGLIVGHDCEESVEEMDKSGKKLRMRAEKNEHDVSPKGIWYHGQCRCAKFIRSCSASLSITHFLYLTNIFVHFTAI